MCKQIRQTVNGCDYMYIVDNANFPYGNKDKKDLIRIANDCVELANKLCNSLACIVIACNTLTAIAIDWLRQRYPYITFVGTEPAVKQATEYSAGNILVATTYASARSDRLKKRFDGEFIKFVAFPELASMIENDAHEKDISQYIENVANELTFNFDCIVLGCTHFVHVKHIFERIFVKQVFDGNKGVASRVRSIVGKCNEWSCGVEIVLTKPDEYKLLQLQRLLGI